MPDAQRAEYWNAAIDAALERLRIVIDMWQPDNAPRRRDRVASQLAAQMTSTALRQAEEHIRALRLEPRCASCGCSLHAQEER